MGRYIERSAELPEDNQLGESVTRRDSMKTILSYSVGFAALVTGCAGNNERMRSDDYLADESETDRLERESAEHSVAGAKHLEESKKHFEIAKFEADFADTEFSLAEAKQAKSDLMKCPMAVSLAIRINGDCFGPDDVRYLNDKIPAGIKLKGFPDRVEVEVSCDGVDSVKHTLYRCDAKNGVYTFDVTGVRRS